MTKIETKYLSSSLQSNALYQKLTTQQEVRCYEVILETEQIRVALERRRLD